MIEVISGEKPLAEIQSASRLMAEFFIYATLTPEVIPGHRAELAGNFLLVCSLATPPNSHELEYALYKNLVQVGGNRDAAAQFAARLVAPNIQRQVFSLSHVVSSGNGLYIGKRKRWMDENQFVDSINNLLPA